MTGSDPERLYQVACELLAQGVSVLPTVGGASARAKEPSVRALLASGHTLLTVDGEVKASWKALQNELPTHDHLATWFLEAGAQGLGLVTGALSGYVVIDVDLAGLPLMHTLGWQPHVMTPSGGAHIYVKHPGWFVPSNASKNKRTLPPGFDVRGDGGYAMFPPSRNQAGLYRRTDVRRRLTLCAIPYALRQALGLTPPEQEATTPEYNRFLPAEDDRCPLVLLLDKALDYAPISRNRGAFMLGLWANANGYSLDEALLAGEEFVECVMGTKAHPFTRREAYACIRSAYTYPRLEPWRRRDHPGPPDEQSQPRFPAKD